MKKKAIQYTIIFLVVPLILSLLIAIATRDKITDSNAYDGINITNNEVENTEVEVKAGNMHIYLTLFVFVAVSGAVLIYIKQKRDI